MKNISINKKASPSVAALGLAKETGAASRQATTSKHNDITNIVQRQTGEIEERGCQNDGQYF